MPISNSATITNLSPQTSLNLPDNKVVNPANAVTTVTVTSPTVIDFG